MTDLNLIQRLKKDVDRLNSSRSYAARFGTPRYENPEDEVIRWNSEFADDLKKLLQIIEN